MNPCTFEMVYFITPCQNFRNLEGIWMMLDMFETWMAYHMFDTWMVYHLFELIHMNYQVSQHLVSIEKCAWSFEWCLSHVWHLNRLSPCTFNAHYFITPCQNWRNLEGILNDSSHVWNLNGLSHVWHLNGLSPLWVNRHEL